LTIIYEAVTFGFTRRRPPVLRDFSWQVPSGHTVLLGPNGAGKSTLLSLGAAALRPWSGSVSLPGQTGQGALRSGVGWMPQQIRAVPGLRVQEHVAYAGWLKGMSRREAWAAADRAVQAVGLADRSGDRTGVLSGGQLRRVGLAQVLVYQPTVLLLDEPTVGLDPAQRARFRAILQGLDPNLPVVTSTHQIDDLDEAFDNVVVLDHGVIRWAGAVREFLALAAGGPAGSIRAAESAYASLLSGEH